MRYFFSKNSAGIQLDLKHPNYYYWEGSSQKEAFYLLCRSDLERVVSRLEGRYQRDLGLFLVENLSFQKNAQTPLVEHNLRDAVFVSYYLAIGHFLDNDPGAAAKQLKSLRDFRKALSKIDEKLNKQLKEDAVVILSAFIQKIESDRFFRASEQKAGRIAQMYQTLKKKHGKGMLSEINLVIP